MAKTIDRHDYELLTEKETIVALILAIDKMALLEESYWSNNFRLDVKRENDKNNTIFYHLTNTDKQVVFGTLVVKNPPRGSQDNNRVVSIIYPADSPFTAEKQATKVKSALRRFVMAIIYRDFASVHKPRCPARHPVTQPKADRLISNHCKESIDVE